MVLVRNTCIFSEILDKSNQLIKLLNMHDEKIKHLLIEDQPISVTQYEINRCLHTLENIDQLKKYLEKQTNIEISVFMPSNLPLYSLFLFALVPSFVARKVILRPNTKLVAQMAMQKLFEILELQLICPNIEIFSGDRTLFLQNYVAHSDLVVFTGRNEVKDKVKMNMKNGSFMINNGSGHNPIIIAEGADIEMAVEGVSYAKFFNSGQDCAGPGAVFIHESIGEQFIAKLSSKVSGLKLGDHSDKDTIMAKIHRNEELKRLQDIIESNKNAIIWGGNVDMQNKIVHPTIILSDINCGNLNYDEIFGPILFLYTYQDEEQLKLYFKDKDGKYNQNKMYVSLFGISEFIKSRDDDVLIKENGCLKNGVGRVLHNIIVHDLAVDNGLVPYGGYSKGSSSLIELTTTFKSVATPILIPEVMYKIFVEKQPIASLLAVNCVPSMETIEKTKQQVEKREISKEFIHLATETFKSNLICAFMFEDKTRENKTNLDICVCLKDTSQPIGDFINDVNALYEKFDRTVDNYYSPNIMGYWDLLSEIYHLYYQLYGENYNPWLDNQKYDIHFLTEVNCCDNKTIDVLFKAFMIAADKKIAFCSRNKQLFKELEENARKLTNNLVEELRLNLKKFGVLKILTKKNPRIDGQEMFIKLRKGLNYCEILRDL